MQDYSKTQTFFKKKLENSGSSTEECEYNFKPIKSDFSDEHTQSLFEQLEEGAKYDTDIYGAVKSGANLYAKKTEDDYIDCFPIHIAAYNVGCNTVAISLILQTFNDPEERKKYIYLTDSTERNALEILIEEADIDEDIVLPSIKSIFSYLTPDEQLELINSLSKKAKKKLENDESSVSREEEINDLSELNYFFNQGKSINMCPQRRKEESKVLADYDSDDESLGKLDSVYNKKFTARVSYKDIVKNSMVVNSIPELILIPSDWRLETAIQGHQGDHVIAYVLLLSSLSHCKGENVKKLPELVHNLAVNVLPDDREIFLQKKQKSEQELAKCRDIRVEAVSSLRAECDKNELFISAVENNLKKAEIELIARHIEDSIDQFIKIINKLEGESFSQERKESITGIYILQHLMLIIEKLYFLNETKHIEFKKILINAINMESKQPAYLKNSNITDKTLKNIADTIRNSKLTNVVIPEQLLSSSRNLTQGNLLEFLKKHIPLKKYHEGYAITNIKQKISNLEKTTKQTERKNILSDIGFLIFNLFDYPKVNKPEFNDEKVLYQAIPRHLIIINATFSYLKTIPNEEKKIFYDAFLNNILCLQLWEGHQVETKTGRKKPLNLELLKEKVLEFATLNDEHNFAMKPKSLHSPTATVTNIIK